MKLIQKLRNKLTLSNNKIIHLMIMDDLKTLKCSSCENNVTVATSKGFVKYCDNAYCPIHKYRIKDNESILNQQEVSDEYLYTDRFRHRAVQ